MGWGSGCMLVRRTLSSSGFGIGPTCGSSALSVFGVDRWPSASEYIGLAGEEVRFFNCSQYGMCKTAFRYRL